MTKERIVIGVLIAFALLGVGVSMIPKQTKVASVVIPAATEPAVTARPMLIDPPKVDVINKDVAKPVLVPCDHMITNGGIENGKPWFVATARTSKWEPKTWRYFAPTTGEWVASETKCKS